jgi:hypothetical protein
MPKTRTGRRRPIGASERKDQYIPFLVSRAQLKAYKAAAAIGFRGNVADFIRAACDDLAARIAATEPQLKVERTAFLRAAADALVAHLERGKPPAETEP